MYEVLAVDLCVCPHWWWTTGITRVKINRLLARAV